MDQASNQKLFLSEIRFQFHFQNFLRMPSFSKYPVVKSQT